MATRETKFAKKINKRNNVLATVRNRNKNILKTMAVNQVGRTRKSKQFKNCPRAISNAVPNSCSKLTFSELVPDENYKNKAIIGKIKHLYPIGRRKDGHHRKILITDALDESENVERKLSVFLLNQYATDSETSAEIEGFVILIDFLVENVTNPKANDWPVQILVKNADSGVWFCRKVNKENSSNASPQAQQVSDEEEAAREVSTHHYEYTKLCDLTETGNKESCNIYGIVDNCNLKVTGKKLQILDLSLTDQTDTGFTCSIFAGDGEIFPNVHPGDIVRIHRMQVCKFRSKLKGRCPNPKFILVFSKSNEGDKPRTVAKTFTFTSADISRFRELFEWYKAKNEPKLICELKIRDFANIICQVIGVYVAKSTDAVIVKIWDGTKTEEFPGVHYGMKEEKLDQRLFTVARHYYVVLSVYGHHTAVAAELEPGQYIEVCDAHLYSTKDNPESPKLCIHAGNKEGRGINVLSETDERVIRLKERLDKIIADTLEFGNQTEDLLSQNNSMFLNYDISVFNSQQNDNKEASTSNGVTNEDSAPPENPENGGNADDISVLNQPLLNNVTTVQENRVISVVDASIKPGQSTQEFGPVGMQIDQPSASDEEHRISVASEPDPLCNLTPLQTRYFFHDPQRSSTEMADSIFPTYVNATQDDWWSSVATVSITDGHSDVKPNSLAEVVRHSVPYKFRVLAAVFCFKPNSNSIHNFIHLCCPKCLYISEDAYPSLDPFETRDGLPYYFCPVCSKESDCEQKPILEYTFLISLSLHDGSGPPSIEVYIWRENAEKFFKGITAEEALRDSATADSILHMLWNICPNCRPLSFSNNEHSSQYPTLDCCILSYSARNDTRYQMFDTILI